MHRLAVNEPEGVVLGSILYKHLYLRGTPQGNPKWSLQSCSSNMLQRANVQEKTKLLQGKDHFGVLNTTLTLVFHFHLLYLLDLQNTRKHFHFNNAILLALTVHLLKKIASMFPYKLFFLFGEAPILKWSFLGGGAY